MNIIDLDKAGDHLGKMASASLGASVGGISLQGINLILSTLSITVGIVVGVLGIIIGVKKIKKMNWEAEQRGKDE